MTKPAQATPQDPLEDLGPGNRLTRLVVHPAFISLLLAAATLIVFYPVVHCQFVTFDDPDYVTTNAHVTGGLTPGNVAWAFRTGYASNWHPLTWVSHMVDYQLYGLRPAGHHLTNLLFHALNSVLLFVVLRRLTGALWRSALVAALFALHPLHVESVAWIAERKDVLSAFFFMLTLGCYGEAQSLKSKVQSWELEASSQASGVPVGQGAFTTPPPSSITPHATRFRLPFSGFYLLSLFFFALGLMSKPMLVTVPFVLLLLDYWPLERFKLASLDYPGSTPPPHSTLRSQLATLGRLVLEKWPFFLLSLLSCLVTVLVQERAMQPLTTLSVGARIGNALVAYIRYLGKTIWPVDLATPYPHPGHWPVPQVLLAVALLAGLMGVVGLCRKLPFVATGWLWFLGTLVPVIGLVQVGEQSMADRYTYVPLIGVFIILAWGAGEAAGRLQLPKIVCGVAAGLVLFACALRTRDQLRCWQSSESLYRHAVAVTKNNWIAYYDLGSCLDAEGHIDEAMTNYLKAVEIQPHYPDPLNNIGCALAGRKQFAEAVPYFEAALRTRPDMVSAHENLANALRELGKLGEAIPHLRAVVKEKPDDTGALNALGNALASEGQYAEAITYYEASLRAKPDQAAGHYNLANALAKLRRTGDAISQYRLAIQQDPDHAEAHHDLGMILARQGKPEEAMSELREAVRRRPNDAGFRLSLGKVLAARRQVEEATMAFTEAVRIAPKNPDAQNALGTALAMMGKLDEAIPHFEEALRYRPDNPGTHFNLGKALATQGKSAEAIRHFNEALRLKPDFAEARQELQALETGKPK